MRKYMVWVLCCMMFAAGFAGCGSSGGDTVVVVKHDDTRANGSFTVMVMDGSSGNFSTDYGTLVFDGAGHGVYTSRLGAGVSTFNYTVTVPGNRITMDNTMIGTINEVENFFTAVDVSNSNKTMIIGIKNATAYTDTSVTFVGGQFINNVLSGGELFSLTTATPTAGKLFVTNLESLSTGTTDYTIASDGTFTVHPAASDTFGAISDDKNIMVFGDAETSVSSELTIGFGLRLPGSGMTTDSLHGTYKAYEFSDDNVSGGPDLQATRYTLTFNGSGSGTYRIDKSSSGYTQSGTFTYTVNSDGNFLIDGSMKGIALQDGSVIALFADSVSMAIDNRMFTMIGIKQ